MYTKQQKDTSVKCINKAMRVREKRRLDALSKFTISELQTLLKATSCPKCNDNNLKTTKTTFTCPKCKTTGHAIKLAKLALKTTDWSAIKHIENLAKNKAENKQLQQKPAQSSSIETAPKPQNPQPQTITPIKTSCKLVNKKENHNLIPEQEVNYIKNNVDIVKLVEEAGVSLKKSGKNLTGHCPFHEDKTPSLVLTPQKNLWNCFGCEKGGSVIDWVMAKENLDFRKAIEMLRPKQFCNTSQPQTTSPCEQKQQDANIDAATEQQLLQQVVEHYHAKLKSTPAALAYLEKRGITTALDKFKLGFADRTLGTGLLNGKQEKRKQLQKLGILNRQKEIEFKINFN